MELAADPADHDPVGAGAGEAAHLALGEIGEVHGIHGRSLRTTLGEDDPMNERIDRCPGPSARDVILGDATPTPAPLLEESPVDLGTAPIGFESYTSPAVATREQDAMWSRVWQWACREEHIPESGDYTVYDVADLSAVVVRGDDGEIRAFANSCLHRGTQLKPPASEGFSPQLRCPYHGWTWSLDGTMTDLPGAWDFPDVDPASACLPQLRVDTWGGFVFVNWDPEAAPLREYLGVLPSHFEHWDLADRWVEFHVRKRLPANWKAAQEAFLEAYHIVETHPQSLPTAGDANAVYDVFDDHVSRFIHNGATPSPHIPEDERPDEQEILTTLMTRKYPGEEIPEIPPGERARDVWARWMKRELSERYDRDLSAASTSEVVDSIEYFVFPNAFFFPGLQFPMVYRFRPDGDDVDRSIFDLLILRPLPESGARPEPAEVVELDVDDSYRLVPGLQRSLADVYDQDTSNLAAQTRGMKASRTGAQQLGRYQESRTRHFHHVLARYLEDAP